MEAAAVPASRPCLLHEPHAAQVEEVVRVLGQHLRVVDAGGADGGVVHQLQPQKNGGTHAVD
jgi:hypothetical protein